MLGFITGLAKADVSLQAAQKLTANIYTKFSLADKAGEVEKMAGINAG